MRKLGLILVLCCALAARTAQALTFVVDFNDPLQSNTVDIFGQDVSDFNITAFGLTSGDLLTLENAVLAELKKDYLNIPTTDVDPLSPIPAGKELNINFVLGEIGTLPSNSDTEYYYMQLGTKVTANGNLGQACFGCVRNSSGGGSFVSNGSVVGSILTDNIQGMGLPVPYTLALSTGNLGYITQAITGTLSHEIGHTLRLDHVRKAGAVTAHSLSPLMGTGALDLPNLDRIFDREFSYSASNTSFVTVNNVALLVAAVGLRNAPIQQSSSSDTPEPSTLGLLLLALVGTAVQRRKKSVRCD